MFKLAINVLFVLALLTLNAFASGPESRKMSNLESTILNNETVLKHESYEAGIIGGSLDVRFTAMVISDPAKATTAASGMKVTIIADKNITSTVYLDAEEVKNLSNAIALIKKMSEKYATEKIEPYTEVMYSSKGGFKFGYLNKGADSGMFESNSALFIRTPTMESVIKNDEKRFGQIQSTVANALYKMSSR